MQLLQDTIKSVQADDTLTQPQKESIIATVSSSLRPLDNDKWIYRLVVIFLGLAVLITVGGGIYLTRIGGTSPNFQLPQGIVAIGSAAVGALAGLLAPSPNQTK